MDGDIYFDSNEQENNLQRQITPIGMGYNPPNPQTGSGHENYG